MQVLHHKEHIGIGPQCELIDLRYVRKSENMHTGLKVFIKLCVHNLIGIYIIEEVVILLLSLLRQNKWLFIP